MEEKDEMYDHDPTTKDYFAITLDQMVADGRKFWIEAGYLTSDNQRTDKPVSEINEMRNKLSLEGMKIENYKNLFPLSCGTQEILMPVTENLKKIEE